MTLDKDLSIENLERKIIDLRKECLSLPEDQRNEIKRKYNTLQRVYQSITGRKYEVIELK